MNCARARFLLYAYLDRELSRCESNELTRHLLECAPCAARGESARGLARVLRSHLDRPAPLRLRERLLVGQNSLARPRYQVFAFAAALALLILPVVSDESGQGSIEARAARAPLFLASSSSAASQPSASLVSKKISGTFVCLQCEARVEAGLCIAPESSHQPAFCADNGEVWRLMSTHPGFSQVTLGRAATVEGVAFPQSGFLRANRVGY